MFVLSPANISWGTDLNSWRQITQEDSINVQAKSVPGSDLLLVKGTTTLNHSIEKIFTLAIDHQLRKEWVDRLIHIRRLKEVDGKLDAIAHYVVDMPWPVKDRDFVIRTRITFDPATEIIASESASIPGFMPEQDNIIRATSHNSTVKLKAINPTETRIEVTARIDPKGSLPIFLVNYFQKRWAHSTLLSLRDALERLDIPKNNAFQRLTAGKKRPSAI